LVLYDCLLRIIIFEFRHLGLSHFGSSGGIDRSFGETTRPTEVGGRKEQVYDNEIWKEFQGEYRDGNRRKRERRSVGTGEAVVGGQMAVRGSECVERSGTRRGESTERDGARMSGQTDGGTGTDDERVDGEEPGLRGR